MLANIAGIVENPKMALPHVFTARVRVSTAIMFMKRPANACRNTRLQISVKQTNGKHFQMEKEPDIYSYSNNVHSLYSGTVRK